MPRPGLHRPGLHRPGLRRGQQPPGLLRPAAVAAGPAGAPVAHTPPRTGQPQSKGVSATPRPLRARSRSTAPASACSRHADRSNAARREYVVTCRIAPPTARTPVRRLPRVRRLDKPRAGLWTARGTAGTAAAPAVRDPGPVPQTHRQHTHWQRTRSQHKGSTSAGRDTEKPDAGRLRVYASTRLRVYASTRLLRRRRRRRRRHCPPRAHRQRSDRAKHRPQRGSEPVG